MSALPGLVVSRSSQHVLVEAPDGRVLRCTVRRRTPPVVCGDRVRWEPAGKEAGVVVAREPRRTVLVRPDHRGRPREVAANVDRLVVVAAPRGRGAPASDPLPDLELLDRYLVAAELSGIEPLVVLNKADLLDAAGREAAEGALETYRRLGYGTLLASARDGEGVEELARRLREATAVVVGASGVGKSSLLKALLPDADIAVAPEGEVPEGAVGRHVTSRATLYRLPGGGAVIDSPGVRSFGLWHVAPQEVARGFVELRRLAAGCRFNDCLHLSEPGCAVREAVEREEVDPRRWRSYRRILEELRQGPRGGATPA